jgi:hypothetical protein
MTSPLWTEHVVNPKVITSIFPKEAPSFERIKLNQLSLICGEDLQCTLHFNLEHFPADAPAKWIQKQYNTVQMSLRLIQVTIDRCVLPAGNGIGDLRIHFVESKFNVEFHISQQVVFKAEATWIHIDNIEAYIQGPG